MSSKKLHYGTELYLSRLSELTACRNLLETFPEPRRVDEKAHIIDWSPDGEFLAVSLTKEKAVGLFPVAPDRDKLVREVTFRGHTQPVDVICWRRTGSDSLASGGCDRTVRLWDSRSQKCQACLQTKGENINASWSPDGNTVAVGSKTDLITFIDIRTLQIIQEKQFTVEVNEISWSSRDDRFFVTTGPGAFQILQYPELNLLESVQVGSMDCIVIRFSPDGTKFGIGSADGLASIWDTQELVCLKTLSRFSYPVRSISFSHDNRLVAGGSEDLFVDISHVETGEQVAQLTANQPVLMVAWHPKRYLLAYSCDESYTSRSGSGKDSGTLRLFGPMT